MMMLPTTAARLQGAEQLLNVASAELEASNHMIALLIVRLGGTVTFGLEELVTSRRVAIVASQDAESGATTLTLRKK
jgi:hypothetical protein